MNNKKVVYTDLFGNYDELQEPNMIWKDWDFLCFTDDKNLKSNIWNIIYVESELSSNLENRKYKILPHRFLDQYEVSLYIDSNIKILKDPFAKKEKRGN